MSDRRALGWLWGAIGVQIAGRMLDARWHATHDEFEGASEQLTAHWLLWLGVLATIVVAAVALRDRGRTAGRSGYLLTLGAGVLYAIVGVWHFVEHANGSDADLAHVFLVIGQVGMLIGAILATFGVRGGARPAPGSAPG